MQQRIVTVLLCKGVGGKGLCGLLGKIEISVCKNTCKAKLTLVGFLSVLGENVRFYIAKRFAYRSVVIFLIYPECQRT